MTEQLKAINPINWTQLMNCIRQQVNEIIFAELIFNWFGKRHWHTANAAVSSEKVEKFKPEFAGKLNFYVTAVNKQMKTEKDNPTIGILICKDKDDVVAEYALDDISQPIGIAEYELTKILREEFKSSLPTVEEIGELSE